MVCIFYIVSCQRLSEVIASSITILTDSLGQGKNKYFIITQSLFVFFSTLLSEKRQWNFKGHVTCSRNVAKLQNIDTNNRHDKFQADFGDRSK